jgi:hypothetical protein
MCSLANRRVRLNPATATLLRNRQLRQGIQQSSIRELSKSEIVKGNAC